MSESKEKPKRKGEDVLSFLLGLPIGGGGAIVVFLVYKLIVGEI